MVLFLQPLLQKDNYKHRRHHKIQPLGIEMDEAAQHAAQCGAGHPVKLVEQRDEEIEPPPVDPLRDLGGAIDAEGLIAHAIDEVGLFPAQSLKFIQHGNAVKKVPRLDHQRHQETLHRRVGRQQHAHRHKFQAPKIVRLISSGYQKLKPETFI